MSEQKKPPHPCEDCGALVSARKKRCGPCTAKKLDEHRQANLRRSRERAKEAEKNGNSKAELQKSVWCPNCGSVGPGPGKCNVCGQQVQESNKI